MTRFAKHQTFDRPQYIVTRDFGKLGLESVTHPEDCRDTIVEELISGQIDRVVSIIEVFAVEGTAHDITEDVRSEVEARLIERAAA